MNKEQLSEVLEFAYANNPLAMAIFDMDMCYVFASEQWYQQYDLESRDLVGKNHYEVFPEILDMPEWLEIHKRVLNGETLENPRDRLVRPDGRVQYQRWIMKPWYVPGSEVQGGAFIFTEDITRQIELEEEKNHLIEQLKSEVNQRKVAEEKLRRLASTDELTGLFNRRHINELLAEEIKRASRYNNAISLLVIDIDDFKIINDTHGHDAGDQVLRAFSKLLLDVNRDTDKVGRWGGEEFVVVLPHASTDKALTLAERVRSKVEADGFQPVDCFTVSIGVTTYKQGDTAESLIKRADTALYAAKNNGKNRVEAST
ncbi:MAG: diguanylate cyclase [Gammaproteobacteria bacterium]